MFGLKSKKNKGGSAKNASASATLQPKCTLPCVLSIAGSDSSGGAGIQADIKTIQAQGLFAQTAITAITAQNTQGVRSVQNIDTQIIEDQIDAVFEDMPPAAVKIGMVSTPEVARAISAALLRNNAKNIVVDPVMVATSGSALAQGGTAQALQEFLFPLASVITPNLSEAEVFAGFPIKNAEDATRAAHVIQDACANLSACAEDCGNKNKSSVLIKGGHGLAGPERFAQNSEQSSTETRDCTDDLLLTAGGEEIWIYAPRVCNENTHGTGCTLSSAIASYLALGCSVPRAVCSAKEYVSGALLANLDLGSGAGPLDHFWQYRSPL